MSFQWDSYLAKGVPVSPGSPTPTRREIHDLTPEEMYLYTEGLKNFQNVDDANPMSWYELAGIHGLPYETAWPRKSDTPVVKNNNKPRGYCTHSSILFLPWHRPYLALFEAQLYKHVNAIAQGITDGSKQKYLDAAKSFRMPYWDWARRDIPSHFPRAALTNASPASGPPSSNSQKNANYNPLYTAPLPANVEDPRIKNPQARGAPFDTTVRYPENDGSILKKMTSFYNSEAPERNLSERVSNIMRSYSKFASMSNNALPNMAPGVPATDNAGIFGSLEDIHNTVHSYVGGTNGHMAYPQTSAFDPIFWLHHTNIDRLFAIWQALHENSSDQFAYVTPQKSSGNASIKQNTMEDLKTPLVPFRMTATAPSGQTPWYTPETVKRTEDFGYAYPETSGLKYPTSPAVRAALDARIQDYYSSTTRIVRQSKQGIKTAGDFLLPQSAILKSIAAQNLAPTADTAQRVAAELPKPETLLQESLGPDKPFLRDLAPDNKYLEWLVNIKAEKHSLGGTYKVHIFLDDVTTEDPALWPFAPHHVGTFYPFGQAADTGCVKCQEDHADGLQISGQIPLTLALVERYLAQILPDITVGSVEPYLTKNLHWRVEVDGQVVTDRSQVGGLTVYVVSNEVTLPTDPAALPVFAPNVVVYPHITAGRGDGTGLSG